VINDEGAIYKGVLPSGEEGGVAADARREGDAEVLLYVA
jgi:hypothetical protein